MFANITSLPVIAKLLESTVDATPVSCEPSPRYNPKEAVDIVLELMLPEDVIFANNTSFLEYICVYYNRSFL